MQEAPQGGPLTPAEVQELDSTLLPALERHHLRLLAHGLRSLQSAAGRRHGSLPDREQLRHWILSQPQAADAPEFAQDFMHQLQKLGAQLEVIAVTQHCEPLALSLDQLTRWARHQADQRTSNHTPSTPRQAASQPLGPG